MYFHAQHFLDEIRKLCFVENDCLWPGLVKLQSFLLNKLRIALLYFENASNILVWSDSWFCRVVRPSDSRQWKTQHVFFKKKIPPGISPLSITEFNSLAFPTWWMYSVNPCGNSILSCNAKLKSTFSWMSLNCLQAQEFIGRVWIQAILKSFLHEKRFGWRQALVHPNRIT